MSSSNTKVSCVSTLEQALANSGLHQAEESDARVILSELHLDYLKPIDWHGGSSCLLHLWCESSHWNGLKKEWLTRSDWSAQVRFEALSKTLACFNDPHGKDELVVEALEATEDYWKTSIDEATFQTFMKRCLTQHLDLSVRQLLKTVGGRFDLNKVVPASDYEQDHLLLSRAASWESFDALTQYGANCYDASHLDRNNNPAMPIEHFLCQEEDKDGRLAQKVATDFKNGLLGLEQLIRLSQFVKNKVSFIKSLPDQAWEHSEHGDSIFKMWMKDRSLYSKKLLSHIPDQVFESHAPIQALLELYADRRQRSSHNWSTQFPMPNEKTHVYFFERLAKSTLSVDQLYDTLTRVREGRLSGDSVLPLMTVGCVFNQQFTEAERWHSLFPFEVLPDSTPFLERLNQDVVVCDLIRRSIQYSWETEMVKSFESGWYTLFKDPKFKNLNHLNTIYELSLVLGDQRHNQKIFDPAKLVQKIVATGHSVDELLTYSPVEKNDKRYLLLKDLEERELLIQAVVDTKSAKSAPSFL